MRENQKMKNRAKERTSHGGKAGNEPLFWKFDSCVAIIRQSQPYTVQKGDQTKLVAGKKRPLFGHKILEENSYEDDA